MHPYAVDRMVQERQQELHRLSRPTRVDPERHRVPAWRWRVGHALAAAAVTLCVPRARRAPARRSMAALLGLEQRYGESAGLACR